MATERGCRSGAAILGSLALALALTIPPALAVTPDEMLRDPALEARARALSEGLRCMVCQNESIDDSDAPLAHDIRVLLRERIAAGDSDRAVTDFLVARYGEFILLKPRLSAKTLLLWGTPVVVLLAGVAVIAVVLRRRRRMVAIVPPLSPDESATLARIVASREPNTREN